MKQILSYLLILLAVLACTPNLDPEIPGSGQENEIAIQSVELNTTSLSLQPGEKASSYGTVRPDNAAIHTVTWSSSDKEVSIVSQDGEVTAVAEGNCVITVDCYGKKATCNVTVAIVKVAVASVSLDNPAASLLVGETLQLTATVLPENATDKTVTWTSSSTDVATVENGLVTAVAAGEAVITAAAGECSATCTVTVTVPFNYGGMCMEAVTGGTIGISNPNQFTIEYKVENNDWTSSGNSSISISAKAGERVWFRGQNATYTTGDSEKGFNLTTINCYNGDFYLYGNMMSLIYGDEYEGKTELTGEYTFYKFFSQNSRIINHPTLDIELPATTLAPSCYRNMFYSCTKLTRAPKLPAKVLTEACYSSMFAYCSALKEFPEMAATDMAYMSCTWMMMRSGIEEAPELPAINLARSCYEFMFMECPNLKKAMSVLPATELAPNCYTGMFQRADKLENAPELPATDLKYSCYSHMFNGCKALTKAAKLPAMSLAEACYQRMFGNSGLTEAPELPAMDMQVMCYQYMFQNCTELEKAPVFPATQLNYWCYEYMFNGCAKLNYIKALFLTKPSSSYTPNWVEGVAEEGTFVKNPDATWDVRGVNGVPEGWTIQKLNKKVNMKPLLKRLKAEHIMRLLISNHYGEVGLKGAPLLRISAILEQTKRLAPSDDEETRNLWVSAMGEDGNLYWFRFRTWVYQDLYGLDILEERHMSITCLTNKETMDKYVDNDFYDKFLTLALTDITDLVDSICKDPAAYNRYVDRNLPKQLRYGRIQRDKLVEIVPTYKLSVAEPTVARQALIALIGGRTPTQKKMTIREYCKWYRIAYNAFHHHTEGEEEKSGLSDTAFYDLHSACCPDAIKSHQYDVDSEADYLEFAKDHYGEIGLTRCNVLGRRIAPDQWKIDIDSGYVNLTEAVLDVIAALYKAGAPLYVYDPAAYLAVVDGTDYFAVKPNTYHDYRHNNDDCGGSLSLPYPDEIYEGKDDPDVVWTRERLDAVIVATKWKPLQKVKKNSPA